MAHLNLVLALEGERRGIKVNTLAPGATTRMTENLNDPTRSGRPEQVSPAVLYLCSEEAPQGVILQAGAGRFATIQIKAGPGIDLGPDVSYEDFMRELPRLDIS